MATLTMETVGSLDLSDITNLTKLLDRLPQGAAARTLATRMGVWTSQAHDGASQRKTGFPTSYADLTDDQLSNSYGYWVSELGRAAERVGLLEGVRKLVELSAKQNRARAPSTVRKRLDDEEAARLKDGLPKGPKPTVQMINDLAEEEEIVVETENIVGLLAIVSPSAGAFKEACAAVSNGLSREISFRQAQLGARIRS